MEPIHLKVLEEIQRRAWAAREAILLPILPRDQAEEARRASGGAGVLVVAAEDLVRLVGAGVLGAFAQWAFNRVVRRALPPPEERGPSRRVLGELRHIREQLDLLQGEIRGLGRRVGSLERGGGD